MDSSDGFVALMPGRGNMQTGQFTRLPLIIARDAVPNLDSDDSFRGSDAKHGEPLSNRVRAPVERGRVAVRVVARAMVSRLFISP